MWLCWGYDVAVKGLSVVVGESDPLKSCEEACAEWAGRLVESGAGT
jgi:hypothetical protein